MIIADITLAEAVPAELVAGPISERLNYSYFSSHMLSFQANAATLRYATMAIQVAALIITLPIVYCIESRVFDVVYAPATKKVISKLRKESTVKNSESFK